MTQQIKCIIAGEYRLTELLGKPVKTNGITIGQISSARHMPGTKLVEIQATIDTLPQWPSLEEFTKAIVHIEGTEDYARGSNKSKRATTTTKGTLKTSNKQQVIPKVCACKFCKHKSSEECRACECCGISCYLPSADPHRPKESLASLGAKLSKRTDRLVIARSD